VTKNDVKKVKKNVQKHCFFVFFDMFLQVIPKNPRETPCVGVFVKKVLKTRKKRKNWKKT